MSSVTRKNARNTISLVQTSPRWVALAVRSEEPVVRLAVARQEANTQILISVRSSWRGGGGGRAARGGGGGFEDILRQMGMGRGGPQVGPQTKAPPKGVDLEQEITIPFAVAVLGGKHHLSIARPDGKVDSIDVKIPAGIEQAKKIRLKGQGHANGRARGDLMIKVKIAPHPTYTRQGLNLGITVPITLREAVEGAKIDLPTPHGTVSLSVPAGSSSGKSLRLKGMGIRSKDRSGDLIATLQVKIPQQVSASDRELIKQLGDDWNQHFRSELSW